MSAATKQPVDGHGFWPLVATNLHTRRHALIVPPQSPSATRASPSCVVANASSSAFRVDSAFNTPCRTRSRYPTVAMCQAAAAVGVGQAICSSYFVW